MYAKFVPAAFADLRSGIVPALAEGSDTENQCIKGVNCTHFGMMGFDGFGLSGRSKTGARLRALQTEGWDIS